MMAVVNAQPRQGAGPCGGGSGPGGQRVAGYGQGNMGGKLACLDLTEEQQEQLKTLRLEHYKVMKPLKAEMSELKAREHTLFSADETDLKALYSVIDDQTALMNKMRKLQAEHKLEGKNILTDEQLMKLEQRRNFAKKKRAHNTGARQKFHRHGRQPVQGGPRS